jgi:beta-lactam-binding protein with PASTA domain
VGQQYFAPNGSWNTRIARIGTCQPAVTVPDVRGDTLSQAAAALSAAGLTVGTVSTVPDNTCEFINLVKNQSPGPGAQVPQGTAVNLTFGKMPPPPFQCP